MLWGNEVWFRFPSPEETPASLHGGVGGCLPLRPSKGEAQKIGRAFPSVRRLLGGTELFDTQNRKVTRPPALQRVKSAEPKGGSRVGGSGST